MVLKIPQTTLSLCLRALSCHWSPLLSLIRQGQKARILCLRSSQARCWVQVSQLPPALGGTTLRLDDILPVE